MQRTGSSFGIIVALIAFLSAGLFMAGSAMAASVGEGDDLEIGGQGVGEGKFGHIQDITFDGQSKLYVLDGAAWDIRQKQLDGNLLVQKFSNDGKFISQFPIKGDGRGEQNLPQRIAVDQTGRVYLTVPGKDRVECYDAEGKPSGIYEAPGAMGITIWKHKSFGKGAERIAVIGGVRRIVGGKNAIVGGDVVHVIEPGKPGTTQIKLEQPAGEVVDLASGADGLLYIKPAAPTIIKVDDAGKTVQVIGSGKQSRAEDGSELLHTVALDSTGRIYSMTFGNPGRVAMFSSDFKNVSLRDGQFKWADPWSTHSQYVAMAVDTSDRVWLAVPEPIPANDPHYATRHFKPVVLRIQKGFFDPSMRVTQQSTKMLGLLPSLKSVLPYSIAYDLKPIEMQLSAPASNRNIDQVELKYVVYDMYKNKVSDGQLDLKLEAGKEAVARFNFTPPAYGWYTTECQLINQGELLTTMGAHVGVTPRFAGMVALSEGESKGGWEDAPRQMFVGLSNMRLHPKQNLDEMDASVALAEKYGATFFVQLTGDAKLLTPEFVRPILERFKGRVKYWEPVNEPNFSSNPEKLVEAYKWFYPMVKEIDPRAKVMGPAVCGIQLPWHEAFFKAGGAKYLDVVSMHDYEGHEGIDLYHWQWKLAELRKLMTQYGIGDREIWQTERVITGIRGDNALLPTQAVRTTFHRDMLESLGISPDHNNHYYLNEGGYSGVPAYVWSSNGPHPAAMALRTRYAMTLGQTYRGTLDFGPSGNDIFMGLRYANDKESTLVLRNLGTTVQPLELTVTGNGSSVTLFDAFGNQSSAAIESGKVKLTIGQMPTYVRLTAAQQANPVPVDYGRNIASSATFSYSGRYEGDMAWLSNGIIENFHAGHPWGGTNGQFIWKGDLTVPQTLTLSFDQPRTIHRMQVIGTDADNNFCALRDYDLEYSDGGKWVTIEKVFLPIPPSSAATTAGASANTWYLNNYFFVHEFAPVTTDKLRIRILRTTNGFLPDDRTKAWDNVMPQVAMLREVRVFSPAQPVQLTASLASEPNDSRVAAQPIELKVQNDAEAPLAGSIRLVSPKGWAAEPSSAAVSAAARQKAVVRVAISAPSPVNSGTTILNFALLDSAGRTLDIASVPVTIKPSLKISPKAPVPQPDKKTLSLGAVLTNTGKEPISGSLKLRFEGPSEIPPQEQPFGPLEPGKQLAVDFPVQGLDMQKQAWKAYYSANVADVVTTAAPQDLCVRPWLVLGPLPNGADDPLAGQTSIDTSRVVVDRMGNELKWLPVLSNGEGYLDLLPVAAQQNTDVWAYAQVLVKSPTARTAILAVGADDSADVLLNGQPVLTSKGAAVRFATQKAVSLKSGTNRILVKPQNVKGGWGFYLDVLGEDGRPMTDLTYLANE